MSSGHAKLQRILLNPAYHDTLAILKGARNGLVYGTKVRFPHAFVMALIFARAPWPVQLSSIYRATKTHALNLAKFVSIYKTLMLVQRSLNSSNGKKERSLDTFFAGLVGGWMVFGERTPINEQIVLYVLSRVVTSFLPREPLSPSNSGGQIKHRPIQRKVFELLAALSWGTVMWLFANKRERLQPGMVSSMQVRSCLPNGEKFAIKLSR